MAKKPYRVEERTGCYAVVSPDGVDVMLAMIVNSHKGETLAADDPRRVLPFEAKRNAEDMAGVLSARRTLDRG